MGIEGIEIEEISRGEIEAASDVLFQAFRHDPLMQWILITSMIRES